MEHRIPQPTKTMTDLVHVAQDHVRRGQELLGGLVCCSVFEMYIRAIGSELDIKYGNADELITVLLDEYCSDQVENKKIADLDELRKKRNDVIHANSLKDASGESIPLPLIKDCTELVGSTSDLFLPEDEKDDEYIADSTFRLFPNLWLSPEGELPQEILPLYFSDLIAAQKEYVQPLGKYLQMNCLNKLDGNNPLQIHFGNLSRVNRTSGYVWMSAVPDTLSDRRSRVYLPGLTVLFMPHEIAVYLELPGKSHKYKKVYYEQMLQRGKIKDFLLLPNVKTRNFEFFHTWWYAMRQPIGSVSEYLKDRTKKRKEWEIKEKTENVLMDLNAGKSIFTQNFFLIGKGYPRGRILNSDLRFRLHKEIMVDLTVLYQLQKMLLKQCEQV